MGRELVALVIVLAGCRCEGEQSAAPGSSGAPALASKAFYRLTAAAQPPCVSGATCEARLVVTALGDYHVNERYPFKLEVDPGSGIEVDGTGTFVVDGEKSGTLTMKFRASKPGSTRVTGTFKLSVCTDENCEIDSPKIAFDVTAT